MLEWKLISMPISTLKAGFHTSISRNADWNINYITFAIKFKLNDNVTRYNNIYLRLSRVNQSFKVFIASSPERQFHNRVLYVRQFLVSHKSLTELLLAIARNKCFNLFNEMTKMSVIN